MTPGDACLWCFSGTNLDFYLMDSVSLATDISFFALVIRKLRTEFSAPLLAIVSFWVLTLPLCLLAIPFLFSLSPYFSHFLPF